MLNRASWQSVYSQCEQQSKREPLIGAHASLIPISTLRRRIEGHPIQNGEIKNACAFKLDLDRGNSSFCYFAPIAKTQSTGTRIDRTSFVSLGDVYQTAPLAREGKGEARAYPMELVGPVP